MVVLELRYYEKSSQFTVPRDNCMTLWDLGIKYSQISLSWDPHSGEGKMEYEIKEEQGLDQSLLSKLLIHTELNWRE